MSRARQGLGREGEARAEAFLETLGYQVLARRFRCPLGEVDLVCSDGPVLVFVEVKTRREGAFGAPGAAVDGRKQARLARVAAYYLGRHGGWDRPCRFDVVAVTAPVGAGEWRLELIRDAFRL